MKARYFFVVFTILQQEPLSAWLNEKQQKPSKPLKLSLVQQQLKQRHTSVTQQYLDKYTFLGC